MKNSNNLTTFAPVLFGAHAIMQKGGSAGEESGTLNNGGTYQSPPFNPNTGGSTYGPETGINPGSQLYPKGTLSKTVEIIDINGDSLVGAHLKWNNAGTAVGTITNASGEATINVPTENTEITITYVGKRTHITSYSNLGSLITLQDNVANLPPVVVGTTKPTTTPPANPPAKKNNALRNIALGVGAIFLISALTSDGKKGSARKSVGLSGTKSKKRKSGKKGKKRKGLREPAQEITL